MEENFSCNFEKSFRNVEIIMEKTFTEKFGKNFVN